MGWLELLKEAVDRKGGQAVARELGYSVPTLSLVINDKYGASTAAIEARVLAIYGGGIVEPVPAGRMADRRGNWVPVESIKEIDLARDELVKEIVGRAKAVAALVADFRRRALGDIQAFVELSAERYQVKLGGVKGNVSLHSYDGRYKVVRANDERLVFDEGLQAAKALIDECLREWTQGSRTELQTIVNDVFQVDKTGRINVKRVLELKRYDIEDPRWVRAMDAIAESLQVLDSRAYIRIYERQADGSYQQMALDVSAA